MPRRKPAKQRRAKRAGTQPPHTDDKPESEATQTDGAIADLAIVLVHGIGNQAPRSVLENMAQPCVAPIAAMAAQHGIRTERLTDVTPLGAAPTDAPHTSTLHLKGSGAPRRILFVEAVWSRAFDRPPWWFCIYWALRCLPAVILLLAPDQRDAKSLLEDSRDPSAGAKTAEREPSELDDQLVLARFGYRMLFAALLVGLPVAAVIQAPILGVLLGATLIVYLASRRSVVGHVVVAATQSSELEKIFDQVRGTIDWASRRARKTIVIAHSQGGYISHQILSGDAAAPPLRDVSGLIGVGSGLKPIWLMRHLARRGVLVACWIWFLAVTVGEVVVLSLLTGMDQSVDELTMWLVEQSAWLVVPIGIPEPAQPPDLDQLQDALAPFREVTSVAAHFGPLHAAGLVFFFAGTFWFRRRWGQLFPPETAHGIAPPRVDRWEEFSSYHDPVGRMLFPALPAPAKEHGIAVGGHPVLDHVGYFSRTSVLPWRIACVALADLGLRSPRIVDDVDSSLQLLAARRRALRAGIFAVILFFALVPALVAGRSMLDAIAGAAPGLLLLATLLSVLFTVWERKGNAALLKQLPTMLAGDRPVSRPAAVPLRRRAIAALVLLALAACGFLSAFHLFDYPSADANSGGALLLMGEVAVAYMLAVAAGYRPWRWGLLAAAAICVALHLATVPPIAHPEWMSEFEALPGVTATAAVLLLSTIACFALPSRSREHELVAA